jgi:hypothetical protein
MGTHFARFDCEDFWTVIPTTRAQWTTMTTKAVEKNTYK